MPTRRAILKATATTFLAAASSAALPDLVFSKAPLKGGQAPGYYRLNIGAYEVTALSDGTIAIPLAKLYANTTVAHAEAALAAAFQGPSSQTSVNAYLVNTGERLVLIDAGTGTFLGPTLGKLVANIQSSGYKPEEIDDVILTHVHTDHSGGLVAEGKRVFANATVRVNRREAEFWLDSNEEKKATAAVQKHFAEARACLTPYIEAEKFEVFGDDAEILPGLGSVLMAGHTPGHSAIVIESQGQKLMFWGDITHGDVLQFDEPDVAIAFDVNQQMAVAARKAAFQHAADGAYLVAGAHIAFPGIGHLRRDDTNYDWVPLNYSL
ncbi:MBL fold metallo-hydrolase [Rhizobium herbae]|uniref:MBL fold metallo-hydrolase n=1 Tax=Rhizobium herbae TaxID=508661 RepID=A0ABS7H6H5_9HYPH|nr:MBL fold metallo-hydrolase [Rhizobium herbae]MBW9062725.1 MBL fold metallo-hydrolase [Rhizobium herbae]